MILYNFIASLRNAIKHQKITFKYSNSSSNVFKILDILITEGLIQGYTTFNTPYSKKKVYRQRIGIIIFFRLNKGRYNSLKSITNVSLPSWPRFASYIDLQSYLFKNPSSVFLLSTDRGLISSSIAIKIKMAGKVLFQFN